MKEAAGAKAFGPHQEKGIGRINQPAPRLPGLARKRASVESASRPKNTKRGDEGRQKSPIRAFKMG
jgi:hypothetical protein